MTCICRLSFTKTLICCCTTYIYRCGWTYKNLWEYARQVFGVSQGTWLCMHNWVCCVCMPKPSTLNSKGFIFEGLRLAVVLMTCVCCLQDRKSIIDYHVTYMNRPKIYRAYNVLWVRSSESDRQPHCVMGWGVGNRHNEQPRTTTPTASDQWLPGIILLYSWLAGVQFVEFMTFNVESEFLSLFVHGYKRAESRDTNLALRHQLWVAIFCKAPLNPFDKKATREHEDDMVKIKECLQGQHGFESQEECQWALVPPSDVDGFVSGKIWAIARVGGASDVREVEKQQLHALSLDEAQAKYLEIAGSMAANELRDAPQNRGMGVTKAQYRTEEWESQKHSTLTLPWFAWRRVVSLTQYDNWFDTAANVLQEDGSRKVCRLKQTCTPRGADRKWVTTVTDVIILN